MQSLNYKAFGMTLKIYIFFPSDSLIRRVNFTSQRRNVLYELTAAITCRVMLRASLSSFQALRRSTEDGLMAMVGLQFLVLPRIHKQIKKKILSFKIYRRVSRITAILLRFTGPKNPFCGFFTPFPCS